MDNTDRYLTLIGRGLSNEKTTAAQARSAGKAILDAAATVRGIIDERDRYKADAKRAGNVVEQMRAALQEADTIMGHDDAETEWRERWAHLWPMAEPMEKTK